MRSQEGKRKTGTRTTGEELREEGRFSRSCRKCMVIWRDFSVIVHLICICLAILRLRDHSCGMVSENATLTALGCESDQTQRKRG